VPNQTKSKLNYIILSHTLWALGDTDHHRNLVAHWPHFVWWRTDRYSSPESLRITVSIAWNAIQQLRSLSISRDLVGDQNQWFPGLVANNWCQLLRRIRIEICVEE